MSDVTLKTVGDLFEEWRASRYSRAELIPKRLWDLAVSLYPGHKRSKICKHLRLCASEFKKRLMSAGKVASSEGFVLAAVDTKPVAPSPDDIELTIQGQTRLLRIRTNINALNQVLPQIGVLL